MKFRPGFVLGLATVFGAGSAFAGDCGCGNGASTVVAAGCGSVVSGGVVGGGEH